MKNVYKIGRFRFNSYAEYKKGLEDVKKINQISKELDINDPGVAQRLYTLVRQRDIRFQSTIGQDYMLYLSDLMANNYKKLEDGDIYQADQRNRRIPRRLIGLVCIVTAILCIGYFLVNEAYNYRKNKEWMELQESRQISKTAQYIADILNGSDAQGGDPQEPAVTPDGASDGSPAPEPVAEEVVREVLPEYADLHAQNEDMVGWVSIEGTSIDYPVMQSPGDNDYYLKHNFNREEDRNGCIFLDYRNSLENGDTNLILYGHNMRSGQMFGGLKNYLEQTFLQEHSRIQFNTLYERRTYQVLAVCLAQVGYQDEEGFRYYNYLGAASQEEFDVFRENIARMNLYGDELDISYGDELITLSTCNSYIEDGRMFLVAKRVD